MEAPHQTIERLLTALETLARDERFLLESGDFVEALAVQAREAPLVEKMAELLVQPGIAASLSPSAQSRAQTLLALQSEQSKRLSAQQAALQEDLQLLRAAQARVQQLRPAYRQAVPAGSFVGEA